MNNNLTIFNYTDKQIRTALDDKGEPLVCLADLCNLLDISNPSKVASTLKKQHVTNSYILDSNGRTQSYLFVKEPAIYKIIFASRKPESEKIQDWIFEEVLPSIRRTGSYSVKQLSEIEVARNYVAALEREHALTKQIESDKKYTDTGKALDNTENTILIEDFVKSRSIKIGRNLFFSWLRDNKILMTNPRNRPFQKFVDAGYFIVHEHVITDSSNKSHAEFTTRLTGKGQNWLWSRWLSDGNISEFIDEIK